MKHIRTLLPALLILALLAACAPQADTTPPPAPVDTEMPLPSSDGEPVPVPTEMIAVQTASHTDSVRAYTFDYPAAWMLDSLSFGERAPGGYQLTSWTHDPGMVSEVPADGTLMDIFVQLWDPKADLPAFIAQRRSAWEASSIEIVSEESLTLANGQPAVEFVTRALDGTLGYFLFTLNGEDYLIASGSGNLDLVRLTARSLR